MELSDWEREGVIIWLGEGGWNYWIGRGREEIFDCEREGESI